MNGAGAVAAFFVWIRGRGQTNLAGAGVGSRTSDFRSRSRNTDIKLLKKTKCIILSQWRFLFLLFFSHCDSNSNPNKKASYPIATLTISSEDTWMLSSFWSWGRALITVSLNITEVKIYIRLRCVNHGCDGFGSRSHGSESLLNFFITFF